MTQLDEGSFTKGEVLLMERHQVHHGQKRAYPEGLWLRLWSSFIAVDFFWGGRERPTSERGWETSRRRIKGAGLMGL